jgi:hypothetical protein
VKNTHRPVFLSAEHEANEYVTSLRILRACFEESPQHLCLVRIAKRLQSVPNLLSRYQMHHLNLSCLSADQAILRLFLENWKIKRSIAGCIEKVVSTWSHFPLGVEWG